MYNLQHISYEELQGFFDNVYHAVTPGARPFFWALIAQSDDNQKAGRQRKYPVLQDNTKLERLLNGKSPRDVFMATSTVYPEITVDADNNESIYWSHKGSQFAQLVMVVLDDLSFGEAASSKGRFSDLAFDAWETCSFLVETSKANYQIGFILDSSIEDYILAQKFVQILYAAGEGTETRPQRWDWGGNLVVKLVRAGVGYNTKIKHRDENGEPFAVKLHDYSHRRFSPQEILDLCEIPVTFEEMETAVRNLTPRQRANRSQRRTGGDKKVDDPDLYMNDPVWKWLMKEGYAPGTGDGKFFDVVCPWAIGTFENPGHSEGGAMYSGYSPLGQGEIPGARVWCCFHHCPQSSTDFVEWALMEGCPCE